MCLNWPRTFKLDFESRLQNKERQRRLGGAAVSKGSLVLQTAAYVAGKLWLLRSQVAFGNVTFSFHSFNSKEQRSRAKS